MRGSASKIQKEIEQRIKQRKRQEQYANYLKQKEKNND